MSVLNRKTHTVTHRRPVQAAGAYGNAGANTPLVLNPALGLRIEQLGARELDLFGKTTAEVSHIAYAPKGLDVREEDELVDGTRVYRVTGVNRAPGGNVGRVTPQPFLRPVLDRYGPQILDKLGDAFLTSSRVKRRGAGFGSELG